MTARSVSSDAARQVVPFVVVAIAGLAMRTPLAAAYPLAAALIFLWIVADTLMLALVAQSRRPGWRAVLARAAGACAIVALASPPPLRQALATVPALEAAMALLVAGHLLRATVQARRTIAGGAQDRWSVAAAEYLPAPLIRVARAELYVLHLALFRWGCPADIPPGCRGHGYHRHLAPMGAALLVLSAIEMTVYHLLIGHWSRTASILLFAFSDIGFVYLLGLVKSFRIRPVLTTPDGVRIRAGLLIDRTIPLETIAGVSMAVTGDQVRAPTTLNAALLAWPNIVLTLEQPIPRGTLLRRNDRVTAIAFRLDDPDPFVRLLRWRLEQARPRA